MVWSLKQFNSDQIEVNILKGEARQDKCKPAVQLETVIAYFELVIFLNSFSKSDVYFPCVSHPLFKILDTFLISWLVIFGTENFIFCTTYIYLIFNDLLVFKDLSTAKQTDIKSICSFNDIIGLFFLLIKLSIKFLINFFLFFLSG